MEIDNQQKDKRDEFAKEAMRGLIANHAPDFWWMTSNYTNLAMHSYRIADAMMEQSKSLPTQRRFRR